MNYQSLAEKNTILRVLTGSQAYGTSVEDGKPSDRDEKGVCIEPLEVFMGFNGFEQFEYRSAEERTGIKDAKSEAGDLDLVIYSLRKFLRLALKGNPQIVEMFFLKTYLRCDANGMKLQELAPYIVSRSCGNAYLGYMNAQLQRLLGERGQKGVNRPELVEKYGYDTKYAMHIVRLGLQGVELLQTGHLSLPLPDEQSRLLRGIRQGELSLQEVLEKSKTLEETLKELVRGASPLQDQPDRAYVEDWMINTYWRWWRAQRYLLDNMDTANVKVN
jgi:predicted nucleotidyltransferase